MRKFDAVILSGGGTKAITQLGVLHFYHELGEYDPEHVTDFAGTSAGAIITLLSACGFAPMEIFTEVYSIHNFFKPGSTSASLRANFFEIVKDFGLISIKPAFELVENMIIKKLGKIPTLRELFLERGKRYYATAVNLSKMRLEYFTPERNPNLKATDAAKISSGLPFIFQRTKYRGDYYVDGGLGDNFPIEAINPEGKRILGVTVTGTDRIDASSDNIDGEAKDMSFMSYCTRIVLFPINTNTYLRSKNLGNNDVTLVAINMDDIPTLQFVIPSEKKMEMFMRGYTDAKREHRKERIVVWGWTWSESHSAMSSVDAGSIVDAVGSTPGEVSSKDGWDVDFDWDVDENPPPPPTRATEITSSDSNLTEDPFLK